MTQKFNSFVAKTWVQTQIKAIRSTRFCKNVRVYSLSWLKKTLVISNQQHRYRQRHPNTYYQTTLSWRPKWEGIVTDVLVALFLNLWIQWWCVLPCLWGLYLSELLQYRHLGGRTTPTPCFVIARSASTKRLKCKTISKRLSETSSVSKSAVKQNSKRMPIGKRKKEKSLLALSNLNAVNAQLPLLKRCLSNQRQGVPM